MDGARVVVVDDDRDSREMLGAILERCGAEVVACECAEAALASLRLRPVHLLVADIAMPDIDGYELMRRVGRENVTLPALAVTAYARPEDRARPTRPASTRTA